MLVGQASTAGRPMPHIAAVVAEEFVFRSVGGDADWGGWFRGVGNSFGPVRSACAFVSCITRLDVSSVWRPVTDERERAAATGRHGPAPGHVCSAPCAAPRSDASPSAVGRQGRRLRDLVRSALRRAAVAPDETVILLHPPLALVGVSIVMGRERSQQNDSLVNG